MHVLERKILKTIRKYKMLSAGDKVLVALSGGVDSIVLLRVLHALANQYRWQLAVAHLDHQMRLGSSNDALFAGETADKLGLPFFTDSIDVPQIIEREKRSPEEAARVARYEFLEKTARFWGADCVALGHNLNDRAETFLLNLVRGSGLKGLAGMPPIRGEGALRFVRPLIECTREEIEGAASVNNWSFREDPTNQEPLFTRNRVRQELLPLLSQFNPHGLHAIARASEILFRAENFLEPMVDQAVHEVVLSQTAHELLLDREKLLALDEFMVDSVLRKAICMVKGNLNGVEAAHLERAIEEIHKNSSGSWVPVVEGVRLVLEPTKIRLTTHADSTRAEGPFTYVLSTDGPHRLGEIGWDFEFESIAAQKAQKNGRLEAFFDLDKIKEPIVVRSRRPGDRFRPLGLRGEKKIQDILVDAKIPRERRGEVPILCDSEGILWVVGLRVGERAQVKPTTLRAMRIKAIPHGQE